MTAHFLIGVVPTIINAITNRGGQSAIVVFALELSSLADSFRTRSRFIVAIFAVLFAVTFPVEGDTPVILTFGSTTVLEFGAISNASSLVWSQDKVVWTFTRHANAIEIVWSDQAQV